MKSNIKFLLISCLSTLLLLSSCSKEEADTSHLYIVTGYITDVNGTPISEVSVEWNEIEYHHNTLWNTFTDFYIGQYETTDIISSGTTDRDGLIRLEVNRTDFESGSLVINNSNESFNAKYATQSIFFDDNDFYGGSLSREVELGLSATLNIVNDSGPVNYVLTGDHTLDVNGNPIERKHEVHSNETVTHNLIAGQSVRLKYQLIDTTFILEESLNTFQISK